MRLLLPTSGTFILTTLLLLGCGGGSRSNQNQKEPELNDTQLSAQEAEAEILELSRRIFVDPNLTVREKGYLAYDSRKLKSWQIRDYRDSSSTLTSAYARVFGSENANAVPYIFERISALISVTRTSGDEPDQVVASNLGFALWIEQLMKDPQNPEIIDFGTKRVRLDSSRAGIVLLGKGYTAMDSSVFRVATLVHESRHSDCPEGVTGSQIEKLKQPNADIRDVLGTCGFTHILCPSGHDLEGLYACERPEGWGAYAVEAIYLKGLYQSCVNCTETERQQALVTYIDSQTRVQLERNGNAWKALSSGAYGLPDMRQQAYREY